MAIDDIDERIEGAKRVVQVRLEEAESAFQSLLGAIAVEIGRWTRTAVETRATGTQAAITAKLGPRVAELKARLEELVLATDDDVRSWLKIDRLWPHQEKDLANTLSLFRGSGIPEHMRRALEQSGSRVINFMAPWGYPSGSWVEPFSWPPTLQPSLTVYLKGFV